MSYKTNYNPRISEFKVIKAKIHFNCNHCHHQNNYTIEFESTERLIFTCSKCKKMQPKEYKFRMGYTSKKLRTIGDHNK